MPGAAMYPIGLEGWKVSTVSNFIAQTARMAPETIALEANSGSITYHQLLASADRLAARLIDLGAASETVVGVCLPRSFEQITACLAVLRSGAAYLPLDPAWPKERLHSVLSDAGSTIVVTSAALAKELSSDNRTAVVFDSMTTPAGLNSRQVDASAEDLAYVIYTSGSTGEPKGVDLTHGNLSNLVS